MWRVAVLLMHKNKYYFYNRTRTPNALAPSIMSHSIIRSYFALSAIAIAAQFCPQKWTICPLLAHRNHASGSQHFTDFSLKQRTNSLPPSGMNAARKNECDEAFLRDPLEWPSAALLGTAERPVGQPLLSLFSSYSRRRQIFRRPK